MYACLAGWLVSLYCVLVCWLVGCLVLICLLVACVFVCWLVGWLAGVLHDLLVGR